jgi:4-diphosphocytidyl-2-C-methyl-D-erythritol kinase
MPWHHTVFVPAFAKINLTLEVLGRRDDGFHDLASVLQTVSLHDTLALRPAAKGEFTLACDDDALAGDGNLALRAARAVAHICDPDQGVHIELRKETPTQAGLGGGSSDAAAVLLALPRLWGTELPAHEMVRVAATLGSDVPFFLTSGTAVVTGRGERVTPLPDVSAIWIVLAKPAVAISTASAFAAITPEAYSDGHLAAGLAEAIGAGVPLPLDQLMNAFETSVLRAYPAVRELWQALSAAGAAVVRLSGSGPTVFVPFRELGLAAQVWRDLRAGGYAAWLTHTVTRADAQRAVPAPGAHVPVP